MSIRYQADADLNQAIVTGVLRREPTIDFQTAFAAGLEGVKDLEVLAIAARQGRILVSHDPQNDAIGVRRVCHQHSERRSDHRFQKAID